VLRFGGGMATTGNCAASIGFLTSVGNFEKPLKEPQFPSAK
jgi:hypothetical protein